MKTSPTPPSENLSPTPLPEPTANKVPLYRLRIDDTEETEEWFIVDEAGKPTIARSVDGLTLLAIKYAKRAKTFETELERIVIKCPQCRGFARIQPMCKGECQKNTPFRSFDDEDSYHQEHPVGKPVPCWHCTPIRKAVGWDYYDGDMLVKGKPDIK